MATISKKAHKKKTTNATDKTVRSSTHQFKLIVAKLYIQLAPCFVGNVTQGIDEYLSRFLMRYMPEVDGVVLAYSGVKTLEETGRILYDSPFFNFHIRVNLTTFSPELNSNIVGVVNKVSPDHIGLLVHGVFNASIPADNIRKRELEWDEDLAAWRRLNDTDQEVVVGSGSVIRFTVAEIVKANEMLTMVGTLLTDPMNTGVIVSPDLPPAPLPDLHEEEDGAMEVDEETGDLPEAGEAMEVTATEDTAPSSPSPKAKATPASAKRKRKELEEEKDQSPETPAPATDTPSQTKPKKKKQKIKEATEEAAEPEEKEKKTGKAKKGDAGRKSSKKGSISTLDAVGTEDKSAKKAKKKRASIVEETPDSAAEQTTPAKAKPSGSELQTTDSEVKKKRNTRGKREGRTPQKDEGESAAVEEDKVKTEGGKQGGKEKKRKSTTTA